MDKTKEAILGTTQVVKAFVEQGHKVIGTETWKAELGMYAWKLSHDNIPINTKRIAVIYFD